MVPSDAEGEQIRLGDWLRAARLRRGFSYAEIEQDTRINRLYLEALEDEHFDVIPAPVYVRGFLRSYARVLGLDPERAIALLPDALPKPPGLEPTAAMRHPYRDAPAVSMPSLPSFRLPAMRTGSIRLPDTRGMGGWLAAVAGVVVLVLAAVYVPPMLRDGDGAPAGAANAPTDGTPAGSQAIPDGALAMPNVVGMQQDEAQRRLQEAGLTWVIVEAPSTATPLGQVERQSPNAGGAVKRGDNVTLIVSKGPR